MYQSKREASVRKNMARSSWGVLVLLLILLGELIFDFFLDFPKLTIPFAFTGDPCMGACENYIQQPTQCVSIVAASSIETPPGGANQSFYVETATQLLPAIINADPVKCGPTALSFACSNYFRPCPSNGSLLIMPIIVYCFLIYFFTM